MTTMKNKLSFILTFISVLGIFLLAWFKGIDIQVLLPSVLAIYIVGRTTTSVSTAWAVSRDPAADTMKAVEILDKKD
jgi:hypothetical protein